MIPDTAKFIWTVVLIIALGYLLYWMFIVES